MFEDKYYKKFKEISKGLENQGYVEWRKEVEKDLDELGKDLDELGKEKLINIKKRCEIQLKKKKRINDKEGGVKLIMNMFTVMVAAVTLYLGQSMPFILEIVKNQENKINIAQYFTSNILQILNPILISFFIIIVLICIVYLLEYAVNKMNVNREIFLEELISIIDSKLNDNMDNK